MSAFLLASCSDDVTDTSNQKLAPLTPIGFGGIVPQESVLTRSDFTVGDRTFWPYNELYPVPINKDYTTIGTFMAQDEGSGAKNEYTSISGYFRWKDSNIWETTVGVKAEQYYIFGYMPSNIGSVSASITKSTASWANGCVLHLKNLSTVTPADVCVVVGVLKAKVTYEGDDPSQPISIDGDPVDPDDKHLTQGVYGYLGTEKDNYVYLLLDHLYTNVNMELVVEPKYAELRTIVLRQVKMKANGVKDLVDVDVTLTNDDKSPIQNIQFPPDFTSSGDNVDAQIYPRNDENGIAVSSDALHPTSVPGYFAPGLTTASFEFEFHYDVYDKKGEDLSDPENPVYGNLVRENCIAINKWTLPGTGVQNGKSFKVTATIRPTYLFMLSEPDLDNPTIELNSDPGNP